MPLSIVVNGGSGDPTDISLGSTVTLESSIVATSYAWTVVSQPLGAAVLITNASSKSCSFVASLEGSYLIQLVTNFGNPSSQQKATCAPAVRELETGERIPALGETTENTDWAQAAVDKILRRVARMSDVGSYVGRTTSVLPANNVVRISGKTTIGADNRPVPTVVQALATDINNVSGLLGVVVSAANGGATLSGLVRVLTTGLLVDVAKAGMTPSVGNPVFVSDTGTLSLSPGTVLRQVGSVVAVSSTTFDVALSGLGGTPILLG